MKAGVGVVEVSVPPWYAATHSGFGGGWQTMPVQSVDDRPTKGEREEASVYEYFHFGGSGEEGRTDTRTGGVIPLYRREGRGRERPTLPLAVLSACLELSTNAIHASA